MDDTWVQFAISLSFVNKPIKLSHKTNSVSYLVVIL